MIALVTDNASNMKIACSEVEKRYPELLTIGCASHIVNLTVEDILKHGTIPGAINLAVNIVRYFKGSTILTGALNEAAAAMGEQRRTLKLPGKTRWQGKLETITSLIANKAYIQAITENRQLCLGSQPTAENRAKYDAIKDIVHRFSFWEKMEVLQKFLKPFLQVTIALEGSKPKASRIYAYFRYLLFQTILTTDLNQREIATIITRRWGQIDRPQYTIAYMRSHSSR